MKKLLPALFFFACGISSLSAADKLRMSPEEYARQRYEVQDRITRMLNAASPLQRRILLNEAKRLARIKNPQQENTQREVNLDDIADLSNYFNKDLYQTVSPEVSYHLIDTTEAAKKEEASYLSRQKTQEEAAQPKPAPHPLPKPDKPQPKTFRRTFAR